MDLANQELKALRRERLRQLLHEEHERDVAELARRGLAVIHDES